MPPACRVGGADRPVLGLTGPAGVGKSALAAALRHRGFAVLQLDQLGHAVIEEPDVKQRLVAEFSSGVLRICDGAVSRSKLADLVFKDRRELDRLNRIVHPVMIRKAKQWLAERRQRGEAAVVEGALVYEFGLADLLDGVLVAEAPFSSRLERLARSRGWTAERLAAADAAQMPASDKLAAGGIPLDASAGAEETRARMLAILRQHHWLPEGNRLQAKEKP